jgi:Protein of unknown function (DUF2934)
MAAREKKTEAASTPSTAKAATKTTKTTKTTTARRAPARSKAVPVVTEEMIADRAYWISQSPECSSDVENWLRAEAELRIA